MSAFGCEVFQNEFLPEGGTDVHAVLSITCTGAPEAGRGAEGDAAEIVILDTSAAMQGHRVEAVWQLAVDAVLDDVLDGTWFAVIAGADCAERIFPSPDATAAMVRMNPVTRGAARLEISRVIAGGGTAMGSWLRLAAELFDAAPKARTRHAVMIAASRNGETHEAFSASIREATGRFRCDCLGLGTDWMVSELREISTALLGTVGLIPRLSALPQELAAVVRRAMRQGLGQVQLRVWAPRGASVLTVRQVTPQITDLTGLRQDIDPLTGVYPTGSWGDETREYHLAVRLAAELVGPERLAARVQLVVAEEVMTEGLVTAAWADQGRPWGAPPERLDGK